ncbi:MAG: class I SAM-dependent DNA methyltransferase, partial [Desulfurococcaceae archaeon]
MKSLDEWIGRPPSGDVLFSALKRAADVIRTAVDYRVLLVFLFYKAVSDKWDAIVKENREGLSEEQAYKVANRRYIKLYDEEKGALLTWDEAVKHGNPAEKIEEYLRRIAVINSSEGQGFEMGEFSDLLNQLGISALSRNQDLRPIVTELIEIFNGLDLTRVDYDVLGDGYQWILANFAPTKAKEGETYTPREVIRLMVRLMDPEDGSKVVDPACGSAAMLIEAYRHVKEKIRDRPSLLLYGQERNPAMAAIAKMNVMLHNVESDIKIYNGDSLINPRFLQENDPMDYSIANPPWNQDGYDESKLSKAGLKAIYKYGYTPGNSADWAWAQLLIHSAKKKAVMVIDQGMLFRGGKEGEIRTKVLKDDLVEAVIA